MRRQYLFVAPVVLALVSAAHAMPVLSSGTYELGNHPGGGQQPPGYGLRLDGLDGNASRIYSFDFEDNRSDMRMTLNLAAGTIRIFGVSWGGRDVGTTYENPAMGRVGLWEIDFTYSANVVVQPSGRIAVALQSPSNNNGYIQPLFNSSRPRFAGMPEIPLIDYNSDVHAPSFFLEVGHRGFPGVSGYGWLNHSNEPHVAASDWLFTVGSPVVIPSPGAASLGLMGVALVGWVRRRIG